MSKPSFNAARRTGTLPKKYSLTKPDNRKDIFNINARLGLADFFPLDSTSPEDCLKQRTITDGFLEPKFVNDESSTLRKQMTGSTISELKGQLLHCIYETEWRRSVLKSEPSSTPTAATAGNMPTPPSGAGVSVASSSSTGSGTSAAAGATKRGPPFPDQVGVSPALQKQWITRLAGSEPLSKLAQQVPHTSKDMTPLMTPEIIYLNMLRATKKSIDPPTEWTTTLTKFLSSLIKEDTHTSIAPRGISGNANAATVAQKHAKLAYVIKLIRWNYSEGLLDKGILLAQKNIKRFQLMLLEMFLGHMTEQLHDSLRAEDGHTLAHLLYPYLPDVIASPALTRKLYTTCAAKRTKISPSLPGSIISRMLDGVLLDIMKYLSVSTDNLISSNTDSAYTPHTPRTPHTPHTLPPASVDYDYGAFDAPKLAEALDDATSQTDLDELYR